NDSRREPRSLTRRRVDRVATRSRSGSDPILSEAFDHPNWAILLLNYGRVRQRLGELDEAKRLFDQCQGICDRSSGTTPLLAETLRKSKDSLEKRLAARDKKKKSQETRDD
ncbi:MAG: tetratricopeptide repeat protein, partial [Planctomycetota bacterium]